MDYRRFGDTVVIRMDKGEEIGAQLQAVCEKERITLASVQAIGATNDFTLGIFNPETKEYRTRRLTGMFEILSLIGSVNTMDGKYYHHLHICVADETGATFGGHFLQGTINITCEMVLRCIPGTVERRHNDEIGINQYAFL